MSASGKRKGDEDDVSEGDAPPSKTFKKDSDDTDEIVVCELSKNRRVMVRNWQGKIVVDIREFYVKDGKQMPGKKEKKNNLLLSVMAVFCSGTFF
ncbi:RNA polymerase II transcriptional coactivator KIWI isoform X2 [Cucumis sativus]|uniref:RNA polymerase II transcriptional coactivator KIWI isoform X2 n=1 Tax=Cucumis sativus TaxID=3659 RepID=UPI0005EC95DA|nr:RNA polymerase II transcriptional coactivator KIWI isoform X2 [Cucumis sativus]